MMRMWRGDNATKLAGRCWRDVEHQTQTSNPKIQTIATMNVTMSIARQTTRYP
jgi:hypothetical protein